jgi:hypothetical protein
MEKKKNPNTGVLTLACHSSYGGKLKIKGSQFRLAWTKIEFLFPT